MDTITTAIIAALSAGILNGLAETGKTAIGDSYNKLKSLLTKKLGAKSKVIQAMSRLEAEPESHGPQLVLQGEIMAAKADQDEELLALARTLQQMVDIQQANMSGVNFTNKGNIWGLHIGNSNHIEQHFDFTNSSLKKGTDANG